LLPRYISSVDSGNLAGHLLTLRSALLVVPQLQVSNPRTFEGLMDTLALFNDERERALTTTEQTTNQASFSKPELADFQARLEAAIAHPPLTMVSQYSALDALRASASFLTGNGKTSLEDRSDQQFWSARLTLQCQQACDELLGLCPWLSLAIDTKMPPGLEALSTLSVSTSLTELYVLAVACLSLIESNAETRLPPSQRSLFNTLASMLELSRLRIEARQTLAEHLVLQAESYASQEYDFLYNKSRHLMAIGYNIDDFRLDNSYYDLLASEARLCTFVGIAQGKLPQESWFALGRLLTSSAGESLLVSWSGSMFEYLMPMLVMPSYAGSLLDNTCHIAVRRQIAYGKQRSLPWGVSESGYSTVDASLNYQYHAFGVPGLGLKRGLAEDSVVAPYASAMALMIAPQEACENLQRLTAAGCEGRFGFFEAVDYTPARLSRGQDFYIVRSFMSHHLGMSLLAIAHLLLNQPMQRRFTSDPGFQATLLLLQEKIPRATILQSQNAKHADGSSFFDSPAVPAHLPIGPDTPAPVVQLLSNGRYHVMVTNAGGGYSHWNKQAITRWREDSSCDNWGMFVYLRDVGSGAFWSAAHQPTLKKAESYAAVFPEGRAEFRRRDHFYETYSEIVVSPEDDIELRRVRITNRGSARKTIELTSYAEVVLASQAADLMQTTFSNLFVQTQIINDQLAIVCTRRPRSEGEKTPWMFHLLGPNGTEISKVSFETDRMKFIGRGQTLVAPRALTSDQALSGSQGSVLDPVVAIRCCITLDAEQSASVDFVTGIADSREQCLALIEKYQDRHFADRAFHLTGSHSGVTLRQINANETDAQLYRRLASAVIYAGNGLRAESGVLVQNRRGQSGLWGYAISGDLPIVLLKITDIAHIDLARQLIQCHAYWRLKGLAVDLVIWNEEKAGYRQQIQDEILGLIATGDERQAIDRPGGIYVRAAEHIPNEDKVLLQAVARAIITDFRGTLEEQVSRRVPGTIQAEYLPIARPHNLVVNSAGDLPQVDLILSNPLGGFSEDGSEYIITTTPTQRTPLPWVNVLANAQFGSVISESGLAYTWSENAHEYRLTPWSDDSVGAASGEAFYLRDEQSGQYWSPTPLPSRGANPYVTRHGFGYSVFEHNEFGIQSTLCVYVDIKETVKFTVLTVRNLSAYPRRISATGYVEWVLGDLRAKSAAHIVTEIDANSGALFARNSYNSGFVGRVAFFDVDDLSRTLTADRTEFLGRNGSLAQPTAMSRSRLSGRVGAALDPCGAIQVGFELQPGQSREIIFRLGAGQDLGHTRELAQRLRAVGTARSALDKVKLYWQQALGVIQVQTPDPALNVMANGWLQYQTLASRLWARSGYYQSGGAYGFRDQLQDVMALVHNKPALVREHLLRAASRQYPQGDVQHWWHPPEGRGVRTRCSDDYLWLPLVVCHYVKTTGDQSVLDELVQFIEGRALNVGEDSCYDLPVQAGEAASLYDHCVRAILHGLSFGERGLPLMGSGDWNDGMDLVGIHGKGESVWLGFFLHKVLLDFAELSAGQSDAEFSARCQQEATNLRSNLDKHGWDGSWYRRAYFDDGTPLGSKDNTECVIDSISQSWSVLSGGGDKQKALQAMNALDARLVRREQGLVQLLDPPFDKSPLNPGYIKGYVPGVRENGGQYTHAAIWAAMAFAAQGDKVRAWEVLTLINPVNHSLDED
ncbi:MAG: glucoamylase family protein, partial [Pseudohongiella sp.]|nr:glucoamylase family protein [Pseudohongiella sp.]